MKPEQPPHPPQEEPSAFVPISDSDFGKLDEDGRTAILKAQHDEMARRHNQLISGQRSLNARLDAHGRQITAGVLATKSLGVRVDAAVAELAANTAETKLVKADTGELVELFKDGKTTLKSVNFILGLVTKVAVPVASIYGGYLAFMAWLRPFIHTWFK